eukprot:scaffold16017_cov183-Amphora_coffeaeformis.AAC.2
MWEWYGGSSQDAARSFPSSIPAASSLLLRLRLLVLVAQTEDDVVVVCCPLRTAASHVRRLGSCRSWLEGGQQQQNYE